MDTIGVRELQRRASSVLRRVERGEVLGVTDRGRLVAMLTPPSSATGEAALVSSGRVRPARRTPGSLPEAAAARRRVAEVVNELRGER